MFRSFRQEVSYGMVGSRRSSHNTPYFCRLRNEMFYSKTTTFDQRRFSFARPSQSDISEALRTLNTSITTDKKTLKKQYMELVKKYHPDKAGGSQEKMTKINAAYKVVKDLSDSEKKAFQSGGGAANASYGGGSDGPSYGGGQRPNASYRGANATYGNGGGAHARQSARAAYEWQRMHEEQQRQNEFKYGASSYGYRGNQEAREKPRPGGVQDNETLAQKLNRVGYFQFMLRFIIFYSIFSLFVTLFWRRRRDAESEANWVLNEGLSEREKMEEIYRKREEILNSLGSSQYVNKVAAEREKDRRVMEWANLKQKEMQELARCGFTSFHPSLGHLHRKAEYPEGVIYFEPRESTQPYTGIGGGTNPGMRIDGAGSADKAQPLVATFVHPASEGGIAQRGSQQPQIAILPSDRYHQMKRDQEVVGRAGGYNPHASGNPFPSNESNSYLPPHLQQQQQQEQQQQSIPGVSTYDPDAHHRRQTEKGKDFLPPTVTEIQEMARAREEKRRREQGDQINPGNAYPDIPPHLLSVRPSAPGEQSPGFFRPLSGTAA